MLVNVTKVLEIGTKLLFGITLIPKMVKSYGDSKKEHAAAEPFEVQRSNVVISVGLGHILCGEFMF